MRRRRWVGCEQLRDGDRSQVLVVECLQDRGRGRGWSGRGSRCMRTIDPGRPRGGCWRRCRRSRLPLSRACRHPTGSRPCPDQRRFCRWLRCERRRVGETAGRARRRRAAVTGQRRRSGRGDAQLLDKAVGVASRVHGLEAGLVHPQRPEVVTVPEEPWDQGLPPNSVSGRCGPSKCPRRAGRRSRPRRRGASW